MMSEEMREAFEAQCKKIAVEQYGYSSGDAMLKTMLERAENGRYLVDWVQGAALGWAASKHHYAVDLQWKFDALDKWVRDILRVSGLSSINLLAGLTSMRRNAERYLFIRSSDRANDCMEGVGIIDCLMVGDSEPDGPGTGGASGVCDEEADEAVDAAMLMHAVGYSAKEVL